MRNLYKFLRHVLTPRNVVWLALTLLLEFGWGALLYALPQFVPDVQAPLLLLMGLVLQLAGLALLGFAVIPVLVGFAVDEAIARLCPAKERS
ncbi:hypothetical protein [Burkholderia ubonensis]|uniref:hypothetical protein n=1 Tax=Burkholderia ubonensis TaxID=101571 RepID=UPI00075B6480|nr:hypothetical protein [Burkholderia ubonensis]KUZ76909.1 hypothetical protein WI37_16145 [Burkholderia ubonensis]